MTDWLYPPPAFFSLTEPNVLQAHKCQDSRNHQDKAQNDSIVPSRVIIITKLMILIKLTKLTAKEEVNVVLHSAFTTGSGVGAIEKVVKLSSVIRLDYSIIVVKEANDHTFVDVMPRTNVVRKRIEAPYHQLGTYN
jgi:hypothetical protein